MNPENTSSLEENVISLISQAFSSISDILHSLGERVAALEADEAGEAARTKKLVTDFKAIVDSLAFQAPDRPAAPLTEPPEETPTPEPTSSETTPTPVIG